MDSDEKNFVWRIVVPVLTACAIFASAVIVNSGIKDNQERKEKKEQIREGREKAQQLQEGSKAPTGAATILRDSKHWNFVEGTSRFMRPLVLPGAHKTRLPRTNLA